jgi:hypothetical protein
MDMIERAVRKRRPTLLVSMLVSKTPMTMTNALCVLQYNKKKRVRT